MNWRWPAAGLGALSVVVPAWDLWKEVVIIFITSTIVWPQGTQPCPSTENWIKDLLSMRFNAHQNKTQFPPQSVSPIEASINLLSFSEGRQTKNHNHRKLTNLITWTTALSNSVKLCAMPCRATQDGQVMVESSDKTWSTGEQNGKLLQYSCLRTP